MWLLQLQNCTANSFNKLYLSRNLIVSAKRKANEFHVFILFVNVHISITMDFTFESKSTSIATGYEYDTYNSNISRKENEWENWENEKREKNKLRVTAREKRWVKNWKIHIESASWYRNFNTHSETKIQPFYRKNSENSFQFILPFLDNRVYSTLGLYYVIRHLKINYTCIFLIRNRCFENPFTCI